MTRAVVMCALVLGACGDPGVRFPVSADVPITGGTDAQLVPPQADATKPPKPGSCQPGALLGCTSPYSRKICNPDGTEFEEIACPNGQLCFGNGECKVAKCPPGQQKCITPTALGQCLSDGSGYELLESCGIGLACDPNTDTCKSSCGDVAKAKSNVGCDYGIVDLGNYESVKENNPIDRPIMVVVSNTSGTENAHITITGTVDGQLLPFTEAELTVPPLDLRTYLMPTDMGQLDTGISSWSWFVKSDQPITLHQFNPQNGPDVRSNDASLLFPTDALGTHYIMMGWKSFYNDALGYDAQGYPKYGFPNYITVLATATGTTKVTVTPTQDIRPSPKNTPGVTPIEVVKKGQTRTFSLSRGQVLNLGVEPKVASDIDLTGSVIQSDKPVAVYMAHNCAFVPSLDVKFCDHLEHQLAPVDTWGTKYAADLFSKRSDTGYDVWRVMASKDQTVVTTNPKVPGVSGKILNQYEWLEYQVDYPHTIEANAPIQVGHYMTGSNVPGFKAVCGDALTGIGDPSFTIGASFDQFIDNYVVLTPPGYQDDWINITRKVGTTVLIDDKMIETFKTKVGGVDKVPITLALGTSGYELVQVPVSDGVHRVESPANEKFGVTGYGYDCDVSYAYVGGMLLVPFEVPSP